MSETLEQEAGRVADDLSASALLALARERKATEHRAAADLLLVAARWADLHPPESIHHAASFQSPGQPGVMRASGEVQVISQKTRPAPPIARAPRCTR